MLSRNRWLSPSHHQLLAIALSLVSMTALAADSGEQSCEIEEAARRLEQSLVAPCCWNQTMAAHQSPTVDSMKKAIRYRLAEGESPESILESFVEEYGTRILARPPRTGAFRLLYWLPPSFLALTAFALVLIGRRLARRPQEERTPSSSKEQEATGTKERHISDEARKRLLEELEEMR